MNDIDNSFVKSLTDVADMARKVLMANDMPERVLTIEVYPSGSYVSCYEFHSGKYDFYEEKLKSQRAWSDITECRNNLKATMSAYDDDVIPFSEMPTEEDDLK